MHTPPDVHVEMGRTIWLARMLAVVCWLVLLQLYFFIEASSSHGWRTVGVVVTGLVAMAVAWVASRKSVTGSLHWVGDQWLLTREHSGQPGIPHTLRLHADLHSLLLVALKAPGHPTTWVWLQQGTDARQWLALRRAVVYATRSARGQRAGHSSRHNPPVRTESAR